MRHGIAYNSGISEVFRISFQFRRISELFLIYIPLSVLPILLSSYFFPLFILFPLLSYFQTSLRGFLFDLSLYCSHAYISLSSLSFYDQVVLENTPNLRRFPINVLQNYAVKNEHQLLSLFLLFHRIARKSPGLSS